MSQGNVSVAQGSNTAGSRRELTGKHMDKEQTAAGKVGKDCRSQRERVNKGGLMHKVTSGGLGRRRTSERVTLGPQDVFGGLRSFGGWNIVLRCEG